MSYRGQNFTGAHPERELCAQFPGVSHAVTGGGLVFQLPNRGVRAAKLTTEVLQNLFYGLIKTDVGFRMLQATGCSPLQIDPGRR